MLRTFAIASVTLLALGLAACGDGEAPASELQVTGTNELAFEPDELSAAAGEITVELTSEDATNHTFVIENGDQQVVAADGGETATGTVTLEPGTYTFFCDVPGHREAGMEGTIEVTG